MADCQSCLLDILSASFFFSAILYIKLCFQLSFKSYLPLQVLWKDQAQTSLCSGLLLSSSHILQVVKSTANQCFQGTGRPAGRPGTKKNSCPGVPLSRDKGRSKCPGTNSSVPARPGTKRFKKFQKKRPDFPFQNIISLFQNILSCFRTSFSVLEHPFSVLERLFPGFWGVILSRDVPGQKSLSRDICSCPCPGTKGHRDKKFFLSRDKGTTGRPVRDCPVPLKPQFGLKVAKCVLRLLSKNIKFYRWQHPPDRPDYWGCIWIKPLVDVHCL